MKFKLLPSIKSVNDLTKLSNLFNFHLFLIVGFISKIMTVLTDTKRESILSLFKIHSYILFLICQLKA